MKPVSIAQHTKFANMVTRVAVEHEGKYLMVQEGKQHVRGLWAFPGGKVDVGEQLTDSAIREIREETGVEVELVGIIGMQHVLWNDRPGFTFEIEFVGKAISIPEQFEVSEEVLAVEWKSLEEIAELVTQNNMRNPGQEVIAQMLITGNVLPISAITEISANPPPEARN